MKLYRWTPKDTAEYLAVDGHTPEMIAEKTIDELIEEVCRSAGDEFARRDARGNEEFAKATFGTEWKHFIEAGRSDMLASKTARRTVRRSGRQS